MEEQSQPSQSQPSVGFLQSATDFSILGSIASIGGDSFTARRDVHVTINHHHPSSPNASSTSSNLSTENQDPEPSNISSMQTQIGTLSDNVTSTRPPPVEIYRRHLEAKGRGISLYVPGPDGNLPIQYQRVGIAIGDVGIVTPSGSFIFLFNICNPSTMPPDLKPLASNVIEKLKIAMHRKFSEHSYLSSVSSVRRRDGDSTGLVFESSEQDGAILTMPAGAKSEDLTNVVFFRKYVAENLLSWYQYAYHDQGYEVRNGDLRVATGTDKASTWGMATFSISGRQESATVIPGGEPRFHFEFGLIDNSDESLDRKEKRYKWACLGGADVQVGPGAKEIAKLRGGDGDDDDDVVYENQCLFIRTLNPTLPDALWEQLGIDEEEEVDYGHHSHHSINGSATGGSSSSSGQGGNSDNDSPFNQGGNLSSSGSRNQAAFSSSTRTGNIGPYCHPTPDYSSSISLADHPSNTINQFLLKHCSEDTAIAVTTDQDWISVLREDDPVIPSSEELLGRIIGAYAIREEDGIVFLDSKCQEPWSPFPSPDVIGMRSAKSAGSRLGGNGTESDRDVDVWVLQGSVHRVSSGSGSSDGPLSDHTVTSDDGFTDYLSEESEAELQRQAEEKALVIAQLVKEENDIRLARQQLVNISLHPHGSPTLGWGSGSSLGPTSYPSPSYEELLKNHFFGGVGNFNMAGLEYDQQQHIDLSGGRGRGGGLNISPEIGELLSSVGYSEEAHWRTIRKRTARRSRNSSRDRDDAMSESNGGHRGRGRGRGRSDEQQLAGSSASAGNGPIIDAQDNIIVKENVMSTRMASASIRRRKYDANFACTVPGCNATFTRAFNLKGHMRSHYEQKPYMCRWPGCVKEFARESDCKRHEERHINHSKTLECEGCGKLFASMDGLNRHMKSEVGKKCARPVEVC